MRGAPHRTAHYHMFLHYVYYSCGAPRRAARRVMSHINVNVLVLMLMLMLEIVIKFNVIITIRVQGLGLSNANYLCHHHDFKIRLHDGVT